jgi:hypothetical protein
VSILAEVAATFGVLSTEQTPRKSQNLIKILSLQYLRRSDAGRSIALAKTPLHHENASIAALLFLRAAYSFY